ncbi:short-chain dehydrogenase/reductase SDR [Caldicellulosiruptor obsidiansis OB47]|mgnify:CR=1 FL=1|jgi:short-subunit dehydrogenase|uniref:Short-chain dehydrogenase/reductase SDR n=1 Tax=Caldicellulosiruptor obsidiansis (strain ATCC BAA-2073 / JCM 16842 / OB47) TaxID=608506 RepID=D9TI29_CALOO|nr:SDR family oxidoreductase [Caldicellulosiruptor obsidiansis]ADL41661.1 short-chain dehydrogenase/reductase SDR [Caldicellulosiruptor obsidiansis OB47]
MVNVKGKWALITGASRGVGYQIATFMAKMGCNLILHGRKLEHLKKISEEVKKFGIETYCVQAEFSEPTQVVTMLDEIESTGIAVDIVFNNAGLQVAYRKDFWKTPIEDFEISFRVNFISAALICYRLIPPMIERGFGRVVNVTSGIKNEPEQAAYSASKAALDKFTKDLSSKLDGTNVMINLADPGWCRTDLGGPNAPNPVESVIPGIVVGAFIDDKKSGRLFPAQAFTGLTLEEAVAKAEKMS